MTAALFSAWPALRGRLATASLGDFPTPISRLPAFDSDLAAPLYLKRDDRSSPIYGGNKVRTLEVLFGVALAQGQRAITAVGAFGSNHAVATVLHAPRVGLSSELLLFPQPPSAAAAENLRVSAARAGSLTVLPHWSIVPWAIWRARRRGAFVMAPGGATPEGALGYVAAGLELAGQIARGELVAPSRVYVGVGSTCTSAGLLVGLAHAARLGLGPAIPPLVTAVRVTPWPVTSRYRIVDLAQRTAALLAKLAGDPRLRLDRESLSRGLRIDGRELGAGYGRPTARGRAAIAHFAEHAGFELDTTYSAKAAAAFLGAAREQPEQPLLFWSTKSSAKLPVITPAELSQTHPRIQRWLARAEREAP
jgi:D-cysteine desulfhydrase